MGTSQTGYACIPCEVAIPPGGENKLKQSGMCINLLARGVLTTSARHEIHVRAPFSVRVSEGRFDLGLALLQVQLLVPDNERSWIAVQNLRIAVRNVQCRVQFTVRAASPNDTVVQLPNAGPSSVLDQVLNGETASWR